MTSHSSVKALALQGVDLFAVQRTWLLKDGVWMHKVPFTHCADCVFLSSPIFLHQPTLHKPGIMAHRVRVLHNPTQKTIRMHYANCNTYNADFDGDEMNCHFPQNDLARAEAQYIAQTDLQYIVPTDGSPLRGLIQDHVVGGVKMTKKDTFFKRWEYQQLLFAALSSLSGLEVIRSCDSIEMVPPAIVKPCELWTGKQVITTLLLHLRKGSDRDSEKLSNLPGLSMERQSKTPDTAFGADQGEHLVLIRHGELLRGVLDKNAFGATDFSLVHAVYEAYGPEKAGLLLNILGRLFTAYIQYYSGHSCRMEDLVLTKEADVERRNLVQRAYNLGARAAKAWADSEGGKVAIPPVKDQPGAEQPLKPVEAASAAAKIGLLLSGNEGKENFAALDGFMQSQLNPLASDIVKKSLPGGLAVPFPHNTFGIMTTTGAKGSIVNQSQVTCALGQQALEGRRVPRMSSGRTLPSFAPYDPNPRADGFVMDRFLTGIRPQEYYFHCMAGREGLVDTAVKTSRSGYLQRCLVKHLEELKICYDYTVRNAEGNVIQFLYGEDGLDPTKASYLDCSARSFEFMARNHDSLKRHNAALPSSTIEFAAEDAARHIELESGPSRTLARGDTVAARRLRIEHDWVRGALCRGWSLASVTNVHKDGKTVDLKYLADGCIAKRVPIEVDLGGAGGKQTMALTSRATIVKPCALDPILSSASRGHIVGSSGACVSERVATAASSAMANAAKLGKVMTDINLSKKDLSSLIGAKYSSSVCAPGEAVGSIAAQSVGEPSTQMTLNTFHLAGAGANVTLGIPRLREIIMTASRTLKTPTMSVPLHDSVTDKQAVRLARGFTKLTLMDLISGQRGISVTERLEKGDAGGWLRSYYVTIKLHPAERIKEAFGLSLHDIAKVIAKNYVPLLSQIMKKELKRSAVEGDGDVGEVIGGAASDYLDESENTNADTPKVLGEAGDLNEEDDDDDDDGMDDVPGEEDGVEFGRRKENASYDDGHEDEISDEDDDSGAVQPSPSMPEQTDPVEEKLNDKCAPTVLKRSNSIALQALKVEPNVRPLLMVGLVEKAASAILVRSRKNIDEAFINDEVGRKRCLQTAGINFEEMWKLDTVKHNELVSNDIWAVRCSYGVEAARSSIMGQIRSVFGAYGIEVDPRHLSLIADYMTYDGGFKPMSRIGMEDSSSTLLQMSFETTAHFLKKAALTNTLDSMESPSANIVVGRPIRHGTGAFSLLAKT
jgi:DNA-directed RNA polymerase I subunit RPA1